MSGRISGPTRVVACAALLLASLWPGTAACADLAPLAGAYYDNLNKVNVKGGVMLPDGEAPAPSCRDPRMCGSGFKYVDGELGLEGVKVTAGVGREDFESAGRIGLSYADFRTQKLAGVEAVLWSFGLGFKLGLYKGLDHTPSRLLLGLGFEL